MRSCICPICGTTGKATYPYTSFTSQHLHPIRRYLKGIRYARHYKAWLTDYYQTVDRIGSR